jgi:hypothetical protein
MRFKQFAITAAIAVAAVFAVDAYKTKTGK